MNEENEKLIKNYFSKYQRFNIKIVLKFFNEYPEIEREINDILNKFPEWLNVTNIIFGIVKDCQLTKCKICGKTLKFSKKEHTYCSKECMLKDKDYLNKIKENFKKSFIKKYGVDNPWKLKEVQQKIKNKFIKKYGVDNPWKVPEIIEKIKKKHSEHINEIVEKRKQTYLKKSHKYDNPSKDPEVIKKIKTANEKYFKNRFWNRIQRWKKYVIPLFSKKEIIVGNLNFQYKWKCVKCGKEFEQRIYTTGHIKNLRECPRCLNCYPLMNGTSIKERRLADFCKQYFPNLKENNRDIIKPFEVDILIPEIHLALEFNRKLLAFYSRLA